MSAASTMRQPEITHPAFRRATNLAFLLGYNARVLGQARHEGNPYPQSVEPRQYKAWERGWDKANLYGLLVELPQQW